MPYKLRKAPKRDLYWVVTSETGKKHSKDPIPKDKAKAQLRILKKALRGGADDGDDAEIAALMAGLNVQEPVQFAPPPLHHAALAANLFEQPPRPPRRKRGVKRAISTVQGTIYENAPKKQKTGKGRKMKGGRLSETWPMLKAHLDEATGKKEFILLPTNQQKSYLIEQMKGAILEMIPLIDEPQEKKELSTRGITYIGRIMSGTFISDVDQEQELKEGLAEVARKPIHEIIGAPTIEDIPAFRRLHTSEHPLVGGPRAATNPTDQKYYYKQSFTNEPYPTEESVELEPTSRDQMLTRLLAINQDTGKYYDDLIRAGVEEALTPKQAEEKRKREEELRKKQEKALAERKKASAGEVYTGKGRKMKGKAMPENLDFLQQIAKESYNLENPKEDINGWILKKWTPTLKFYMKGNDVIVGVRGTKPTDSEDVSADLTIPFNGIPSTNRYKRDKASMQQFQQQYPQSEYSYFAVGHSLGGAIIDTMIRQNLIKEAVSYNPAIQYSDINGGLPNRRIYYGSDPLYRLMGWWDRKSEHREPENPTWADWLGKISAPAAAVAALPAHGLSNFKGGKLGKKLVFT